jgi:hypothetical protein
MLAAVFCRIQEYANYMHLAEEILMQVIVSLSLVTTLNNIKICSLLLFL